MLLYDAIYFSLFNFNIFEFSDKLYTKFYKNTRFLDNRKIAL